MVESSRKHCAPVIVLVAKHKQAKTDILTLKDKLQRYSTRGGDTLIEGEVTFAKRKDNYKPSCILPQCSPLKQSAMAEMGQWMVQS